MMTTLRRAVVVLGLTSFVTGWAYGATPEQYGAALAQVQSSIAAQRSALREGRVVPAAQTPAAVAARVLAQITQVEFPGRAPAIVDTRLLVRSLGAAGRTGSTAQRAQQWLAVGSQVSALRQEILSAGPPSRTAAGDGAVRAAQAVLAGPLYDTDAPPPPSLLDRFTDWLSRRLSALFRRRSAPTVNPPPINPAFIKGLLYVIVAGVFALLVALLVQWLRRRAARPQPLALDETEAVLVEARDTDSLRALADQHARLGDYRRAFRLVYLATLVALDTGGILRFDRSKTNWEYLRALRAAGRADIYEAMTPLTHEFDRLWYGFATADAADYALALTQYEALNAAPSAARSVPAA